MRGNFARLSQATLPFFSGAQRISEANAELFALFSREFLLLGPRRHSAIQSFRMVIKRCEQTDAPRLLFGAVSKLNLGMPIHSTSMSAGTKVTAAVEAFSWRWSWGSTPSVSSGHSVTGRCNQLGLVHKTEAERSRSAPSLRSGHEICGIFLTQAHVPLCVL